MNKNGAAARKHVLLINADREFRDGKAQNFLRPEDIDKIVHTYRSMQDVPGYAKRVSKDDIIAENTTSISGATWTMPRRRSHTMSRAHIHGGVPTAEIDALGHYWSNYTGLRAKCFQLRHERHQVPPTSRLSWRTSGKLPKLLEATISVLRRHAEFLAEVESWWQENVSRVEKARAGRQRSWQRVRTAQELLASISRSPKEPVAAQCSPACAAPLPITWMI